MMIPSVFIMVYIIIPAVRDEVMDVGLVSVCCLMSAALLQVALAATVGDP